MMRRKQHEMVETGQLLALMGPGRPSLLELRVLSELCPLETNYRHPITNVAIKTPVRH